MLQSLPAAKRRKLNINTVALSPDGARYLWGGGLPGSECSVTVCDTATDQVLHKLLGHNKPVTTARFLEDNSVVSFSFDSHICHWTSAGQLSATNNRRLAHRANGFTISHDCKLAVVGDYRGEITGWRIADCTLVFTIEENSTRTWALASEPCGRRLLSGGGEGKIRIWDVPGQRLESEIEIGWGRHITSLAWHPDGNSFLAAIAPDGAAPKGSTSRIAIFSALDYSEKTSLLTGGHQPRRCLFSPDARLIIAAGGSTDRDGRPSKVNSVIHVWDAQTGEPRPSLVGHTTTVIDLAISRDSRWLLSADCGNTIRCWDVARA